MILVRIFKTIFYIKVEETCQTFYDFTLSYTSTKKDTVKCNKNDIYKTKIFWSKN